MHIKSNETFKKDFYTCPTAIISGKAAIGKNVHIGSYSIIGENVYIGDNTHIGPNVYIPKDTIIGKDNRIYYGAVIGADPQDLKYEGECSQLVIGNNNIIREYVTISRGTRAGGFTTRIGNHNLLMGNVHIAHDVQVGNHNIISHYTGLAGHVITEDYVTFGGHCVLHQFTKIGTYSMVGASSLITKDVLPYSLVQGNPAHFYGPNVVKLRRQNFNTQQRLIIRKAFKIINDPKLSKADCLIELEKMCTTEINDQNIIKIILNFLQNSTRGFYKRNNIN